MSPPHDPSSWIELRYSSAQPLPEPSGVRDELDGVTLWTVAAVRCFHDQQDQEVASTEVAVFDLAAGRDLRCPAAACGGIVAEVAALVLDDTGRLRPELGGPEVDAFVLFGQIVIGQALLGQGLAATYAIRDRIAGRRALVGCLPEPRTTDPTSPSFFAEVGPEVAKRWWDRGLRHLADGLWLFPPDPR